MQMTFEQLLLKKLLGTITAEEELDFNLWLKANPPYVDVYKAREKEWTEREFEAPEFSPHMQPPLTTRHKSVRTAPAKRFVIANVVAVVLMAAASFLFYDGVSIGERTISAGEKVRSVLLNDSTVVSLKPHSTLIVPAGFNAKREVSLEGQAYFRVKRSSRPLVIHTLRSTIESRGTSFVVRANEQIKETEVIVFDGRVRMTNKQHPKNQVVVTPGMLGRITPTVAQPKLASVDTVNLLAWKTDRLTFRNSTLYDVANIVSDYYGVDVNVHGGLTGCRFTATFNNVTLDEVLSALGESIPIKISSDKKTITFDAQECVG